MATDPIWPVIAETEELRNDLIHNITKNAPSPNVIIVIYFPTIENWGVKVDQEYKPTTIFLAQNIELNLNLLYIW